jgi:hypothetical protein
MNFFITVNNFILLWKIWYYSRLNEIRRDDICIDYPGGKNDANKEKKVITYPCHGEKGNQEWIYHHNTVNNYLIKIKSLQLWTKNILDAMDRTQKQWFVFRNYFK